jgi:predicted Zn finger-like uncharacterized protein
VDLITRCPACGTAFRVQRDQLAALFGTVRCGKCGSVFNGIAALVQQGAERLQIDPSPQLGLFDPSRRPTPPGPRTQADAPLPQFMAEERSPPRLWLWLLLSVVALGALGAQVYRARSELLALLPESRPALEALCRLARCAVPLPRRPDLVRIVSSDMHEDPNRGVFVLNAVLRNSARAALQYPDVELTLTDAGKAVTRRVLSPAEYLDARAAARLIASGIEAGGEEAWRVHVDARGVRATGYELCIYPSDCLKAAKK